MDRVVTLEMSGLSGVIAASMVFVVIPVLLALSLARSFCRHVNRYWVRSEEQ